MLLGLSCLSPLLEVGNALIKFAQGRDIFIYDFVVAIKSFQVDIYMMYSNQCEHFKMFLDMVENNFIIIMQDWLLTSTMVRKHLLFV
jgi:hypothetical protein